GRDFSANLERNLFRLASFPLRLWTSLIVCGYGNCNTTDVLSGHGLIPSGVITYPRNTLSANPNEYFFGLSFIFIFRACPLFFCRTGGHHSRTLSLCSAMERGIPVMSEGCHAKMSKFLFKREHNSVRPASDKDPPTTTS
nr:hypothetical protein [Tanacetum cinerariifolium]